MAKQVDVAVGIVHRSGLILVCQRPPHTSFAGYWEFPGGKRERDETLEQCVARELREELAIRVEPGRHLTTVEHHYPTATVRLHPFLCKLIDGSPQPIGCTQFQWVAPPGLRDLRFPPANDALIDEVIGVLRPTIASRDG